MTKTHPLKSDAFRAFHASAEALLKVGAIDKATMRQFDVICLVMPTALEPQQIKATSASSSLLNQ